MRIHAYRRKEPIVVDLTAPGSLTETLIKFYLLKDTPHIVADVTNSDHAERLLSVPEAYREFNDDAPATASAVDTAAEAQKKADEARRQAELDAAEKKAQEKRSFEAAERQRLTGSGKLIGSSVLPGIVNLTGTKTIAVEELVASAHRASAAYTDDGEALSVEQWNELQPDERDGIISRHLERLENKAEAEEEEAAADLRAQAERDKQAEADRLAAIEAAKFTLVNGDAKVDLKEMNDTALRAFAKTYEVKLAVGIKGDEIRQAIVDALAPAKDKTADAPAGTEGA